MPISCSDTTPGSSIILDSSDEARNIRKAAELAAKVRLFQWTEEEKQIERLSKEESNDQMSSRRTDFLFVTVDMSEAKQYIFYFLNTSEDNYELIIGHYKEESVANPMKFGNKRRRVMKACSGHNLTELAIKTDKITFYNFSIDDAFMTIFETFRKKVFDRSRGIRLCFHGSTSINDEHLEVLRAWNISQVEFKEQMQVSDKILARLHYSSLNIHANARGILTNATLLHWIQNSAPRELQLDRSIGFTVEGIVGFIKAVILSESTSNPIYTWCIAVSDEEKYKIEASLLQSGNLHIEYYGEKLVISRSAENITNVLDCNTKIYLRLQARNVAASMRSSTISSQNTVIEVVRPLGMQNNAPRMPVELSEKTSSSSTIEVTNEDDTISTWSDKTFTNLSYCELQNIVSCFRIESYGFEQIKLPRVTPKKTSTIVDIDDVHGQDDIEKRFEYIYQKKVNEIRQQQAAAAAQHELTQAELDDLENAARAAAMIATTGPPIIRRRNGGRVCGIICTLLGVIMILGGLIAAMGSGE